MAFISTITSFLEEIAPPSLQESYDNSGLICGESNSEATGVVVSLDAVEPVVDFAIESGANLIVSHHPILFTGLKSLTGKSYIERTIIKAIKNDIAIYAIHTNLDKVLHYGVNEKLAQVLGLENLSILSPIEEVVHCQVRVDDLLKPEVLKELDSIAKQGGDRFFFSIRENDTGIEVTGPPHIARQVRMCCQKYKVDLSESKQEDTAMTQVGAGLLGHLPLPMPESDFLPLVKGRLGLKVIRHTELRGHSIRKVALCGGAGSFLLKAAIGSGADVFITSDYKYHQFFDADGQIVIMDIGHYESEQFTVDLLVDLLNEKFGTFAARFTNPGTNPVRYFI